LKHARRYGAETRIVLRCVDQDGNAVANAAVSAALYPDGSFENAIVRNGTVDTNGCFVMEGKTNGEFSFTFTKDGYYKTRETKHLFRNPAISVSSGRWQPYGMTNTVVLKRRVSPAAMHVHRGTDRLGLPKPDEWTGFDLERADWVSPRGKGAREDFQVLFRRGGANERGAFHRFTLTFRFPKPFDGVYLAEKDSGGSELESVYAADTNHVYAAEIGFSHERTDDPAGNRTAVEDRLLAENEYLVLRVRSETDKEGRLAKANYAKICSPLYAAHYGFLITTYFNPEANNPSLEADTAKNLLNPRDLGFAP
jgi:hypothetical protein